MRTLFSFQLAFVLFLPLCAQSKSDSTASKIGRGFYAYGGIGPAIPLGKYGRERFTGFDLNTAAELRYPSGFILRGMFDFSSFAFERGTISQASNGKVYKLSGSNNLVTIALSGGYMMNLGHISPYVFSGFGASFLSRPDVVVNDPQSYVDTNLIVKGYLSTLTGAGFDILLNPKEKNNKENKSPFVFYLEAFYTHIPSQTETSVNKFNLVSINIGLKSKF
ncbi:MAG: hypothetical protein KF775_18490 [Cyclobacteriaceae bacterium]|nr:hypothetical protein [Cyclobacteriaceae bacterium]